MSLSVVLVTFPVIFLGELPDKTMFANLVMATSGKPRQVWLGASAAFAVHVAIATTVGVALFAILPKRALDVAVAALFLGGAAYAWWLGGRPEEQAKVRPTPRYGATLKAFVVIFIAEWGDLTQFLTANLAAHYRAPLSVAVGSVLALWSVAALAVISGQTFLKFIDIPLIRRATAVMLLGLAAYSIWSAVH